MHLARESAVIPVVLRYGESVTVLWPWPVASQVAHDSGGIEYAALADALGNQYRAPFPGMKAARAGLRRHRVYVPE